MQDAMRAVVSGRSLRAHQNLLFWSYNTQLIVHSILVLRAGVIAVVVERPQTLEGHHVLAPSGDVEGTFAQNSCEYPLEAGSMLSSSPDSLGAAD